MQPFGARVKSISWARHICGMREQWSRGLLLPIHTTFNQHYRKYNRHEIPRMRLVEKIVQWISQISKRIKRISSVKIWKGGSGLSLKVLANACLLYMNMTDIGWLQRFVVLCQTYSRWSFQLILSHFPVHCPRSFTNKLQVPTSLVLCILELRINRVKSCLHSVSDNMIYWRDIDKRLEMIWLSENTSCLLFLEMSNVTSFPFVRWRCIVSTSSVNIRGILFSCCSNTSAIAPC